MPDWGELADRAAKRLTEAAERATGRTMVSPERLQVLEAMASDYRAQSLQLQELGWTALDFASGYGQGHEARPETRRHWARVARTTFMTDPMAGASVDLMNDFVFGLGMSKPTAYDEAVQEIIDEAWSDPVNEAILTGEDAQASLGTDLCLQSNLFLLLFDEGDDGKVQLSLLDHDTVTAAVKDEENRFMILYYVARTAPQRWDYANDRPEIANPDEFKTLYYAHWRNVETVKEAQAQGKRKTAPRTPPAGRVGEGKVLHIAVNRAGSEMVFGVPTVQRTLRWYNAFNDFMSSRVDMAIASAALIMKRQVKGTPNQLAALARQSINVAAGIDGQVMGPTGMPGLLPPNAASIVTENESVTHEAFRLDSGAGDAQQNASALRAQISAASRWPQSYFGDASHSSLATATSLELPVLKMVERRQQVFEKIVRWFVDRSVERAVDTGRLDETLSDEESAKLNEAVAAARRVPEARRTARQRRLVEAYTGQADDEADTKRDLGYQFTMPNPLKRMMAELINSISTIAKSFDPNNTNAELSRVLLGIALGEGLEQPNPDDLVDRILPPGYQDPAVAAAMAGAQASAAPAPNEQAPGMTADGSSAADSQYGSPDGGAGTYDGQPWQSTAPEDVQQASIREALGRDGMAFGVLKGRPVLVLRSTEGKPVVWAPAPEVMEALRNAGGRMSGAAQADSHAAQVDQVSMFDESVLKAAEVALSRLTSVEGDEDGERSPVSRNGAGKH